MDDYLRTFWLDRVPGSILVRRWCDQFEDAAWRWHRHPEVTP